MLERSETPAYRDKHVVNSVNRTNQEAINHVDD